MVASTHFSRNCLVPILALFCVLCGCGRRASEEQKPTPTPSQAASPQSVGGKATTAPLTEQQKITALLDAIVRTNATFIRNDVEYPASAARKFMEAKLTKAADKIKTANDFIEQVATRSSTTGRPYQIKFADGRTTESAFWLRARLAEIERSKH